MIEISTDVVVQVILLARDGEAAADDLAAYIDALNDDEKAQLTALAWVGRGAFEASEFAAALDAAYTGATVPTSTYLGGMPHLAENLAAGLDAMGVDVADAEERFG